MLTNLHWDTLKQYRTQAKLLQNHLNIPADNILTHHIQYKVTMSTIEYKHTNCLFFLSTIQLWNSLPSDIALSPDIEPFKHRLEKILLNQFFLTEL